LKEWSVHAANGTSRILIGETLAALAKYIPEGNSVLITDTNVRRLFPPELASFKIIEVDLGEKAKNLATVEDIYKKLLDFELDRSSFIVGIGGGIVCDIAGFSAATFMRGLEFGFVPTSLLAQVDAAIGGKNGVNFKGYKNLVGTFQQPRFVLCDLGLLTGLPEKELLCGIAEIVKHALIKSPSLLNFLENNWSSFLAREESALERGVEDSIRIKTEIVQADTLEQGERRKLNFGHTLGHAVEKIDRLPHGEAVSIGMVMAAKISQARGLLTPQDTARIQALLQNFGLPTQIPGTAIQYFEALKKDKKRQGKDIHFVLLTALGKAEVVKIPISELKEFFRDLC